TGGAMLGRVLVLSASAGAGHLRAAEAVEKAIRLRGVATEVQHLDVLKYTNQVFRHVYSKTYIDLVNKAPEVLGWLYDYLDDPKKNDPSRWSRSRGSRSIPSSPSPRTSEPCAGSMAWTRTGSRSSSRREGSVSGRSDT